ncbi:MAG: hypothetical protein U0324_20645 [Polyangiales bacterium]
MSHASLTLDLPEPLYQRLARTAQATRQPLEAVALRALERGSPPACDDAPAEFQADLAALDRADDEALRELAGAMMLADFERRDALLERNAAGLLSPEERGELDRLRREEDRFLLRKAHAAALLQWRGRAANTP